MTSSAAPKSKKRVLVIALCALLMLIGAAVALSLSAASGDDTPALPAKLDRGVAAQVGDATITDARIKRWLAVINPDAKPGEYTDADLTGALQVVAVNAWTAAEAARRGVTVSATEVTATEVSAPEGAPAQDVKDFQIREALINKMVEEAAGPVPTATEQQINALAKRIQDRTDRPETRSYFDIAARSKTRVQNAVGALRDGMRAPDAVAEFSDDDRLISVQGFTMGVTPKDLPIEIAAEVFTADLDKPTEPVRIGERWHTFVVTEVLDAVQPPSLADARRDAEHQLTQGLHDERVEKARDELLAQAAAATACSTSSYVKTACGGEAEISPAGS